MSGLSVVRRISLRTRLFGAYGAMLAVAFLALAVGVYSAVDTARFANRAAAQSGANIDASTEMWKRLDDLSAELLDGVVSRRLLDHAELDLAQRDFLVLLSTARRYATLPGEGELVAEIEREFRALLLAIARIDRTAAPGALDPGTPLLIERLRALCVAHTQMNLDALDAITIDAHQRAKTIAWLLGGVAVAALLIAAWVPIRIAGSVTRPLNALLNAADRTGQGEFELLDSESNVEELDGLTTRFNAMVEALARLRSVDVDNLLRERHRIKTVLESIDDGLLIVGANGAVEHANPVALRQLGRESENLIGEPLAAVSFPSAKELDAQASQALNAGPGTTRVGELELGEAPQARVISYSLVSFHDGSSPGLVVVLRDITEQRAFEMLRTQFVLRASHELRTPVTGIRMAFDLLDKRLNFAADSREGELLDTIRQELRRMGVLLNELLDLSRMYARTFELEPAVVEVDELLDAAVQRFRIQAAGANLGLALALNAKGLAIRVDRAQIDRVFDNLINNAIRHTPSGGSITVSATRHGPEVECDVTDTGDGVPAALQGRIFEPFTQYGEHPGSAGLGLALCREIVARHSGRIGLDSATGNGARFFFRLPLA